jgi:nitrous oxidase accessory protein
MKRARKLGWSICLGLGLLFTVHRTAFAGNELQLLIDQTPENGVLQLEDRTYEGNVVITKPIRMVGSQHTIIQGEQAGNVIEIKAPEVVLEHVTVTHSGNDRNSGEEYAAIKLFEDRNVLRDITITDSFHGIYLSQSHENEISQIHVTGQAGEIASQGNGIHLYYSNNNQISENTIAGTRDGVFMDYSNGNTITDTQVKQTRYGLHFMYSNDNRLSNNQFSLNTAGAAVMFSYRNTLLENEFSLNQGSRSFGLMLQSSDDNWMKDNLFYQNLRGVYMDQSHNNRVEGNDLTQNDVGVELWGSSSGQVFIHNRFNRNIASVLTFGGRSNNEWHEHGRGNYWDHAPLLDLNQDQIGDAPMVYHSSIYTLVEDNELAYLFLKSPAIQIYEKINEILHREQVMLVDPYPLLVQSTQRVKPVSIPMVVSIASMVIVLFIAIQRRRRR